MHILQRGLLILMALPLLTQGAELQLGVSDFGRSTNRRNEYIEGQQAQLSVRLVRGGGEKYYGLPMYPPYSMKIEAGIRTSQGFVENLAWSQELKPVHYVDRYRQRADSLYHSKGTPVDADGEQSNLGELYQFCFTIPEAPRDGKFCLRAVYDKSEFGRMESEPQCLNVYRASSENDTRLIWGSMINAAYARGDANRVIALADSFMATGFVDPDWTETAKTAAYEARNYRKALEYLDANWEVNGVTDVSQLRGWNGKTGNYADRRQQDYDRQRKDLLAKIGGN